MLTNYNSRINLKLNISDTINMLLPYFRDSDTSLLNLNSRFSLKQNTLVSGTSIKTINNVNLLSNGNLDVQTVLSAATSTVSGFLLANDWVTFNGKQNALNGTGFVKASGTSISYDNTSYLSLTGGTLTGALSGTTGTFNTRLGVGSFTASPTLFTSGSGDQEIHFTHSDNVENRKVTLRLTNNNSSFYTFGGLIYAIQGEGLNQYNRMSLGVNTSEIMHLTRFSRVGIMNNSPSYTLDVDGTFNATGNSLIGGTLGVTGATTLSTTSATPSLLLGKDVSNVVGAVTTVAQTGLFGRGSVANQTTNANGEITISHGLSYTPIMAFANLPASTVNIVNVKSVDATNIVFVVRDGATNNVLNAQTVTKIEWFAIK